MKKKTLFLYLEKMKRINKILDIDIYYIKKNNYEKKKKYK